MSRQRRTGVLFGLFAFVALAIVALLSPATAPAISGLPGIEDDLAFAQDLIRNARVGLAPGSAFGPDNAGYLRLCFANSEQNLSTALDRLEAAL